MFAWSALAAAVLVTGYGLWSAHLFEQALWAPVAQRRLFALVAAWALWSVTFIAFARRWFVPATCVALTLGLAAASGLNAVAAVSLFLISSWKVGSLLCPRNDAAPLMDTLLRTLLGVSVWMTLLSAAVHFRVNYGFVYGVLFLTPFTLKPRQTVAAARTAWIRFRSDGERSRNELLILAAAAFPLLCHLVLIPKPEIGADALSMHLMAPAWVACQHVWPFNAGHIVWAVMPMGADWCFTGVYLLGGEFAARLLNFAFLAVTAALVYAALRPHAGRSGALLFAGLFVSTPLVQLVTGSLMVENLQAAYLAGSVCAAARFYDDAHWHDLYIAALLAGAALATKFGSAALALPLLAFLFGAVWKNRQRLRGAGRHLALAAGLAIAVGALPYLVAYAKTGNPFFPFLNDIFRSPLIEPRAVIDTRFTRPLSVATPFQAVFHSHDYLEGRDGAAGMQLFLLTFVGAVLWRRRWPALGTLAFAGALLHCVLTFRTLAYLRYAYAALPLFSIAGGVAIGRVRCSMRWFPRAALASVAAALLLNLYFLPASGWWHLDFYLNPFDRAAVTQYVADGAPGRLLVDELNRRHAGQAAAFFGTETIAGLRAESYSFGWHNQSYERQVMELTGPVGYGQLAERLGLRWFVAPLAWTHGGAGGAVSDFLTHYTVPAAAAGPLELRGWKTGAWEEVARAIPERPLQPCDPALIDDRDPRLHYRGRWRTLRQFGLACGGTLTYTDEAEAEVTLQFHGDSISYYYTRAYTRGMAEVLIDGVRREVLDEFSSGIEWRSVATYGGLPPGPHTITIRSLHKKAPASTDFDVDIDGFAVRQISAGARGNAM